MMVHSVLRTALCVAIASLPLMAFGGPAPDTDGDGVPDVLDNCSEVPNAAPNNCDGDVDGFGSFCDADFDQNGSQDAGDIGPFLGFLQTANLTGDMDCNGSADAGDIGPFLGLLNVGGAPGPSGLPCAGSIPCQ